DGYENDGKLKIIGRAIAIEPKLVQLWEKIGFDEICDLVCARNFM
ncbi:14373_t:CDS:1, partial [Funneliformis mosseae]